MAVKPKRPLAPIIDKVMLIGDLNQAVDYCAREHGMTVNGRCGTNRHVRTILRIENTDDRALSDSIIQLDRRCACRWSNKDGSCPPNLRLPDLKKFCFLSDVQLSTTCVVVAQEFYRKVPADLPSRLAMDNLDYHWCVGKSLRQVAPLYIWRVGFEQNNRDYAHSRWYLEGYFGTRSHDGRRNHSVELASFRLHDFTAIFYVGSGLGQAWVDVSYSPRKKASPEQSGADD